MSYEPDDQQVEAELKGNTLRVYWYAINRRLKPIGVREVQRALKFSSPSVASHHLEKLRRLGLLEKNKIGEYALKTEVKVGILKYFVRIGTFMLPRNLFYAIFFTTMLVSYMMLYPNTLNLDEILAIFSLTISSVIFWYETFRIVKEVPF